MELVRNALKEIFIKEIGLHPEEFTDNLMYNSVPEWDSQAHMVIVLSIEEKFGITLDSDDVVSMTSVHQILQILKSRGATVG